MRAYKITLDRNIEIWRCIPNGGNQSVVSLIISQIERYGNYDAVIIVRNGTSQGIKLKDSLEGFVITEPLNVNTPTGLGNLPSDLSEIGTYLRGLGVLPSDIG